MRSYAEQIRAPDDRRAQLGTRRSSYGAAPLEELTLTRWGGPRWWVIAMGDYTDAD